MATTGILTDLRLWVAVLIVGGMVYSVRAGKLTLPAALTGGLLGGLLYLGGGVTAVALLALFFGLGSAASAWGLAEKQRLGLAEENKGRRRTGQVLANAGVAGLAGLGSWCWPPYAPVFQLVIAGSLAAATADTLSSELGNLYGRRYYNILTLRPDRRGENGVVSVAGTGLGVAGSLLVALVAALGFDWGAEAAWLVLAATAGNLTDSLLGATLERRRMLSNNAVNGLTTLVGGLVAAAWRWIP
ncbi:DUF92 domain-containing protein [Hymenobacter sp. B81]|uniref:DUF92 domain-containing protein n=1 Tax=Hymenobacter sp. B81 TaxID=3344878 RepID=UPI0037DBF3D1